MTNKLVGLVLLGISLLLLFIFIFTFRGLATESEQLGCFGSANCKPIQQSISLLHIGFGLFGFILALGVYLLIFSKSDQVIMAHLQQGQQKISSEEKFSILLLALDNFEKKVIQEVRTQDGITQNTLRLRTDMSKAKLSQVLSSLEKKGLVKRDQTGKTLAIRLKISF